MILPLAFATLICGVSSLARADEPESEARGIVQIEASPAHQGIVWQLLTNSPLVLREAVVKVSPEAADAPEISKVAGAQLPSGGDIIVRSSHEKVPADKLLAALVEVVNHHLSEIAGKDRRAADDRLHLALAKVEKLQVQLAREHEALLTMAAVHKVDIDPEVAAQKRLRAETEVQNLDAQLQGLRARQAVIEQQIGELARKVAQAPPNDEIATALQARIDVQQAAVELMKASNKRFAGTVTQHDMAVAEAKLLEAKAELPKYRREAAEAAGGGRIAQLKMRLDDTAIEIAETKARRQTLDEQLQAARNSGQIEMKRIELELLKREYQLDAEELSILKRELQKYVPPRVTVIPLSGAK
jgi:hypothetical protein